MTEEKESFNKAQWARFKEMFKENYGEMPSVISVLFVLGLGEIDDTLAELTKEEKEAVIHVGLCSLLEKEGLYKRIEVDQDGWPHFEATQKATSLDIEKQEHYLRKLILKHYYYEG